MIEVERLRSDLARKEEEIDYLKTALRQHEEPQIPATAVPAPPSGVQIANKKIGISVEKIQLALKNAGFYTEPANGRPDGKTKEAVRAFQKSSGLEADGLVGAKTWAKLKRFAN